MDSGAQTIPEDWTIRQLAEVATRVTVGFVGSMSHLFRDRGVPLLRGTNVRSGYIDLTDLRFISDETHRRWSKSSLSPGDLVMVRVGYPGRTAVVPESLRFANAASLVVSTPRNEELDPQFAMQLINSAWGQAAIQTELVGGAQQVFNTSLASKLPLLLPPYREQRRIAEALSDLDVLCSTLERLIGKKQAIKQGMMQQLLTGKTRLPGFSAAWQPRRLSELLSYEQPGRFLVGTSRQLESGRVPVLTAGKTFVLGYTNETEDVYRAHPVIIFDDFTTASKFVDFDFKAKSSAMKILSARPGADLRFVYERIQLIDFPLGDHKRYWISEYSQQCFDAPNQDEQQAISTVLGDCEKGIETLCAHLTKAKAVKQGMMQELLTGRTRLPVKEGAA